MGGLIKRWIPILVFTVIPGLIVLSGYLLPTNELLVDAARTHGLLHPGWQPDTSHVEI